MRPCFVTVVITNASSRMLCQSFSVAVVCHSIGDRSVASSKRGALSLRQSRFPMDRVVCTSRVQVYWLQTGV